MMEESPRQLYIAALYGRRLGWQAFGWRVVMAHAVAKKEICRRLEDIAGCSKGHLLTSVQYIF